MTASTPQSPPRPAAGDVWAEIIAGLPPDDPLRDAAIARRQMGIDKYGTPLQRANGRDHMADALQEALDGWVYATAAAHPALAALFRAAALIAFDATRRSAPCPGA
jgi:hypothetical protein